MKQVTGEELCRILERHGWRLRRITDSHQIYAKAGNRANLSVPVHRGKPLNVGTSRALLRAAGLSDGDL